MSKKTVNLLEMVPIVPSHITTESEGDISIITFPRFRHSFFQRYLVPSCKSREIHIRLDVHGSAVWNLIDGSRTVNEIVQLLETHFDKEETYGLRILAFIQTLYKQGFVQLNQYNNDENNKD